MSPRNEEEVALADSIKLLKFAWINYQHCFHALHSIEEAVADFKDDIQGIIDDKIVNNEPYDKRSYREYQKQCGIALPESKGLRADDIKAAVRIEDVVGRYVQLRKAGSNFIGLCPFHQEKTGSFTVYTKTQSCHCFGCGEHQDVIGFLMKIENLTFLQALNQLNNNI